MAKIARPKLEFHPVTPSRWPDLEALFGPRGACGGCWCMYWRQTRAEYEKKKGAANRRALKKLVTSGPPPGLIAYANGKPAGWCALAPREAYSTLERSRVLAPIDDARVWSVPCFFVARPFRRTGMTSQLLRAATEYAAKKGARILEGYPVEPKKGSIPDVFAFTGLVDAFKKAGFSEAARRSPTRPIMRRYPE
ncbi:MAG: GNAT family N-acetyltransferase [Acidobacteria bacterium]|nr:GNAT family N-acetyltransferase [Acidobacteriota bacterium]